MRASGGAYPPSDVAVHRLLAYWARGYDGVALRSRFHSFLQVLFEETAKELRRMLSSNNPNTETSRQLPSDWYTHLTSIRRQELYARVTALAVSLRYSKEVTWCVLKPSI